MSQHTEWSKKTPIGYFTKSCSKPQGFALYLNVVYNVYVPHMTDVEKCWPCREWMVPYVCSVLRLFW